MSIKILGGIAKAQSLLVPKGSTIRPTSVQLRRKIFDSRQSLSGCTFIDLCAGSGAVGLEAWSRGAESLHLFEKNFQVLQVLKGNVELFQKRFAEEVREREIFVSKKDVEKIDLLSFSNSVIFFDPPYEAHKLYYKLKEALPELLNAGNELWIESDSKKGLPLSFWDDAQIDKVYRQGDSYLAICRG